MRAKSIIQMQWFTYIKLFVEYFFIFFRFTNALFLCKLLPFGEWSWYWALSCSWQYKRWCRQSGHNTLFNTFGWLLPQLIHYQLHIVACQIGQILLFIGSVNWKKNANAKCQKSIKHTRTLLVCGWTYLNRFSSKSFGSEHNKYPKSIFTSRCLFTSMDLYFSASRCSSSKTRFTISIFCSFVVDVFVSNPKLKWSYNSFYFFRC